jgi:hypothetical protein
MEIMQASRLVKNDLCSNCLHKNFCSHRSNEFETVNVCEEHVIGKSKMKIFSINDVGQSLDITLGLCANCENLTDCILPEKGKEIMECEEYK